jgi:general secretion pathway protein H
MPLSSLQAFPAKSIASVERGFTLLELLAVILIIGIVISFASLSIGQNTSRIVQDEAERLHGLIQLAGEESVLQARELALEFDRDRYQFLELGADGWQPVAGDKMLRERPLPETVELELMLEGVETSFEDKKNLPKIFILSSGELTPFEMTLKTFEGEEYSLQGQINGKLILTRVGNDEN